MPPTSKKLGAILLLGCQSVCPLSRFSAYHIARNVYARILIFHMEPSHHKLKVAGRVAQLVAHLTEEQEIPGSIPGPDIYFRFSFC